MPDGPPNQGWRRDQGTNSVDEGDSARPAHQAGRLVTRLGWLMAGWTLPGVLWFLGHGDPRAALALTLLLGVSIFHLRSLQAHVSRLDPEAPLRAGAVVVVRWGLLIAGLLAVLGYGVSRPIAVAWGVSLLPLALITEAVLAALASRSRNAR